MYNTRRGVPHRGGIVVTFREPPSLLYVPRDYRERLCVSRVKTCMVRNAKSLLPLPPPLTCVCILSMRLGKLAVWKKGLSALPVAAASVVER